MCDAKKDWHEHTFRASSVINGCQKSQVTQADHTILYGEVLLKYKSWYGN